MKENINQLTAILIIVAIGSLYYLSSNTENTTATTDTVEIVNQSEEVNETSIGSLPEIKEEPTKRKITGKISWPKNREAKFYLHDTTITVDVDWIGKFEAVIPNDYEGYVTFHHGNETTGMYVNAESTSIDLKINTQYFDETISYEGSDESNYLAWKYLYQEDSEFSPDVYNSTEEELDSIFDYLFEEMLLELDTFNVGEAKFYNAELDWMNKVREYYLKKHEQVKDLPKVGEEAIDFSYPDADSTIFSLSDLRGNYVYVDVWATWCGPCRDEIPYLKELEEEYRDENIVFLSISIDVESNRQQWMDMLKKENLKGLQLISTDGWQSQICKDYAINSIPRFMLFDTEGKVINLNAPKPSEIRDLLHYELRTKTYTVTAQLMLNINQYLDSLSADERSVKSFTVELFANIKKTYRGISNMSQVSELSRLKKGDVVLLKDFILKEGSTVNQLDSIVVFTVGEE